MGWGCQVMYAFCVGLNLSLNLLLANLSTLKGLSNPKFGSYLEGWVGAL